MNHSTEEFDGDHQHKRQRQASHNTEKCTQSGLHLRAKSDAEWRAREPRAFGGLPEHWAEP